MAADPSRYRTPVAIALTIALIAILVLVFAGAFNRSSEPKHAGRHRAHHHHVCRTHHHRCRRRLSR